MILNYCYKKRVRQLSLTLYYFGAGNEIRTRDLQLGKLTLLSSQRTSLFHYVLRIQQKPLTYLVFSIILVAASFRV